MGQAYSAYIKNPDTTPCFSKPPTYDPQYGFQNERKERVMKLTEDEMIAAKIQPELRDYCAHLLLDFYRCRAAKFPYVVGCKNELHQWDHCEHEDYVLRMKEYEREKRLLEREKRRRATPGEELGN